MIPAGNRKDSQCTRISVKHCFKIIFGHRNSKNITSSNGRMGPFQRYLLQLQLILEQRLRNTENQTQMFILKELNKNEGVHFAIFDMINISR